jgi:peptidoglycan/xylan/chitin deacetylase (PgdA/CDA1 family)
VPSISSMKTELLFRLRRQLTQQLARRTFHGAGPAGASRRSVVVYFDYEREFGNELAGPSAERGFRGVLEVLDRHRLRATWFTVGRVADEYPHTLQELACRGHELACHTYSHRPVTELSRRELASELARYRERCADLCGVPVRGFHGPRDRWTLSLPAILSAQGYAYDVARDDDPRRQHAHQLRAAGADAARSVLRIPSVADDWSLLAATETPADVKAWWWRRLRAVPPGKTVAIGFHPWVLGRERRHLQCFGEFIAELVADAQVATCTGGDVWSWHGLDRSR